MIIGNGLVANAFKKYFYDKNILIFASGVSNSSEKNLKKFLREKNLIKKFINKKYKIIYFSSFSIEESTYHTKYIKHKIFMEQFISKAKKFLIFRLPQLAGNSTNPHTLMNNICSQINQKKVVTVFLNQSRNIIDINDVVKIVDFYLKKKVNNKIINIGNIKYYKVIYLVKILKKHFKKNVKLNIIFKKKNNEVKKINPGLNLKLRKTIFKKNYLKNLIKKYY
jgi:nucleoside-diphosphate-sugar epimerase